MSRSSDHHGKASADSHVVRPKELLAILHASYLCRLIAREWAVSGWRSYVRGWSRISLFRLTERNARLVRPEELLTKETLF